MSPGLYGVIGVVVGCVLTGLAAYLRDSLATRRKRRTGARLLMDEIASLCAHFEGCASQKWWYWDEPTLSFEAWKEQKERMADTLHHDLFFDISQQYIDAAAVIRRFEQRDPSRHGFPITEVKERSEIKHIARELSQIGEQLDRYVTARV